jgi:formylglycine-generating enzyme required for sulfatase activity
MPEWDTKRILPLLDRLSYTAHRTASSEDGRGRLAKQTVRETLIDFFEQAGLPEWAAFEKAGRCIEYIQQRSGLLIPDENESYMFAHLTLQEHCAGRYIVLGSEDPVKLVLEHRIDDRWHEPIMLGLGLAPPADLDDVLEALVQPDENGQRKSSEHWYQDLVLVSEIGADREWTYLQTLPRIKVAQHQEHLRRGLATIVEDPHVQHTTRIEAMSLLGTLGRDPRLLDPATGTSKDTHYWCSVEAGKFWSGVKIKQLQPMTLPYSFQIARYPVTNGEYRQFIAAGGYDAPCCWSAHGWRHKTKRNWHAPRYWDNSRFNNPVQPVVGLSWWEAAAYCRWLTVQGHAEGWLPHDHQIRLPTSLEWERAARHTDQRLYPWGTTAPTPERANYKDTGIGKPSPVGYFPAGAAVCGAQDIVGNVMEYLALSARQAAQQQLDDDVTPDASVTITLSYYNDPASRLLLGKYGQFRPDYRHNKCGFRLVRVQLGYPGTGGVKTCMKKTTSG